MRFSEKVAKDLGAVKILVLNHLIQEREKIKICQPNMLLYF